MDGILPTEEFMEEEFLALQNEHKVNSFFPSIFSNTRAIISYVQTITLKCKLSKMDKWGGGSCECFTYASLP
jgi:hypothetical protein